MSGASRLTGTEICSPRVSDFSMPSIITDEGVAPSVLMFTRPLGGSVLTIPLRMDGGSKTKAAAIVCRSIGKYAAYSDPSARFTVTGRSGICSPVRRDGSPRHKR